MKKHHTKEKGDLGVLKAQLSLFEQGYLILQPVTEHAPFDLVAYKDNAFKRVQVKYKSLDKSVTLRAEIPKNNQNKHIKFVTDYLSVP